jgi:hypothetical protein
MTYPKTDPGKRQTSQKKGTVVWIKQGKGGGTGPVGSLANDAKHLEVKLPKKGIRKFFGCVDREFKMKSSVYNNDWVVRAQSFCHNHSCTIKLLITDNSDIKGVVRSFKS